MANKTKRKQRKFHPLFAYLLFFLIGVLLFAWWDRNDIAEFYVEVGALIINIPILVLFYALVNYSNKRTNIFKSLTIQKYANKLSWLPPVVIFVISAFYIYPHLTHALLQKYGTHGQAYVTDHYYIYDSIPIGFNGIFAGAHKTDEFSAHTEVVKYKTVEGHISGTIDFPYDAYDQKRESPINTLIRQHKPIEVVYLRHIHFITKPITPTQ